ncbi:MAG: PEGA domain-containing protein [Patescibacteria group bacterium]|nr:PEGA domain-containing protein [Patescibacteria group bacterium]
MKKLFSIFCLLLSVSFLSGCTLPQLPWQTPAMGALQVTSVPRSTVYLDDKEMGKTPYSNEQLPAGDYTLRLTSDLTPLNASWQTNIKLSPRVLTVVSRDLGPTDILSSGHIVSLEPLADGRKSEINIISTPTGAQVNLDNNQAGVTPYSLTNIKQGEHSVEISLPGYKNDNLKVQAIMGYRLLLNISLGQELPGSDTANTATQSAIISKNTVSITPTPVIDQSSVSKPRIKVLDTPTGWLNVRDNPGLSASISAKINPGEYYPYIDEQNGWVKIKYDSQKEGWVSVQYVQKQL